jgi:type I restriction enzyme S subunit
MNQWKYVKLGEVCTIERGGSPRPIDDFITTDENGINWIKIGDADESMYITKTAQRIKPEGMKKSRYVKPGDFLLSNSMSFGRPYILKIDGCIHDGWLVLRDENNVFDKKFLYYYLSAPITYKKFKSMAVGGVVNNLNSDMVRKVRVPMPSQEEQHQISDRLDRVSNLIFLRKQQLAKLDELVKARFVEMFGDPIRNEKGWNTYTLAEMCDGIGDGLHGTPEYDENGEYPFINGNNLISGIIQINPSTKKVNKKTYEKHYIKISQNAILLSINGTLGRIAFYNSEQVMLGKSACYCNLRDEVNRIFVYNIMKTDAFARYLEDNATKSTIKNVGLKAIREYRLIMPPIPLQNQFSSFVERVDQQKQTVQQSLEKLELMKKVLMQEYFG